MSRVLLIGLAATLAMAGTADAARTFTLGKGYSPAVAVEKDGTGHFAWFQDGGKVDRLRYCQIPRGQNACKKARTFVGTGDASYRNWRPFVFVAGQEVTLVASFQRPQAAPVINDHLVVRSDDGGNSFGTPYAVGDPNRTGPEDAAYDGSGLSLLNDDADFTGTPVGGPPVAGQSAELDTLVKRPETIADPSIALVDNKEPIVTADYLNDTVVFHPPGLSALRSVLIGAWKKAPTLKDENQASLAGGPGGVYAMLISSPKGRCPCKHVFRRWNGTRFASPFDTQQDFTGTGASTGGNHDLFQDRAGRLHAVWTKTRGGGRSQDPTDVRYARSKGGTADFAKPLTLTERGRNTNPVDLDVGTASDGLGFVAWEEGGDSPTGSKSVVRAVAVAPSPQK